MVPESPDSRELTAEFLDGEQYTDTSIADYEAVYGQDFISPGGADMARSLIAKLDLRAGQRVLDVGCGLGGAAFLMAREFALQVDGIDLSHNMIALAQARCEAYGLADAVTLEHGDCLALTRPQRYDAIYSRDVFLHIHAKTRLFETLFDVLRPGGRVLFTDYCCGTGEWSRDFTNYVHERAYDLHSVDHYVVLIESAGFVEVSADDLTADFAETLRVELERMQQLPLAQREKLEPGWRAKLERVAAGEQRWGMFCATRPSV